MAYVGSASKSDFQVLTGTTFQESSENTNVFAGARQQQKKAFRKKRVVAASVVVGSSLQEALSDLFNFEKTQSLKKIGELAVCRS